MNRLHNPLLECLVILTKLHQNPFSAEALTAGLPVKEGGDTPELFSIDHSHANFSRAAARAGFTSELFERPIKDIPPLVLPCILVLKEDNACILEALDLKGKRAKIITPELPEGEEWIDISKLNEQYLGFTFFLKPEHHHDTEHEKLLVKDGRHWFWGTLLLSKTIYADVFVASILINLFLIAAPLFTMNVYDRVVPNNAIETMWVLAIGIFVVYLFDMILKLLRTYFLEVAGKKSDVIMSSILFEKVMNLKMSERPKSVGSFANNLKEFESVRNFLTSSTIATIIDLPFVIIFLLVTYYIAGSIIIAPLIIMALLLLYSLIVKNPLKKSVESTYESAAAKNAILIESLQNLETIKTLGSSGHAQYRWEEATGDISTKSLKSRLLSGSITSVTSFLIQMNTIAVLIMGVYMIQAMELTMGGLIASVILTSRVIAPMGQVAALLANYEHTKTAFTSLQEIMNLPVERPEGKKFVQRLAFKGKITFDNVSFTYPDETKEALKDVSFTIQAGEHVGLIGRVGSGKTTVEKLIIGLYQPSKGSIYIDDIDINQIDPAELRKNIAYVPQDIRLFRGSLRENIVYKTPDIDDKSILDAARIGVVDLFVNHHPMGFDMPIGESGEGISGGQKQSIGIARAFIHDAPVILLDEPSNSMDNTTERALIQRMKQKAQGRTTVVITHKNSILSLVDRLIVFDDGKIVLDGPKDTVLQSLSKNSHEK